jgi:hypothetical protein
MTERNFKQELSHSVYYDMENGNDTETICYPSLISIITELCDRIEALENQREVPYNNVVNIMQEAAEEFKR